MQLVVVSIDIYTSAFHVFISCLKFCLHLSVVISSVKVITPGIALIGTRSTPRLKKFSQWELFKKISKYYLPITKLDWGIYFVATWSLLNEWKILGSINSDSNYSNLPTTRSSTQIDQNSRFFQKVVFFVQLNKLESRTGTVTLLLG